MTRYDPARHQRHSIRLKGYDYTRPGAYFVTMVTFQRLCLFGEVVGETMRLNAAGRIVYAEWLRLERVFANIQLGAFVVMPNHVHGIIVINGDAVGNIVGATHPGPHRTIDGDERLPDGSPDGIDGSPLPESRPKGPAAGSLGAMIGQFKSRVTKRIWAIPGADQNPIWQRNYYEHIVRDQRSLERIRCYILENPLHWNEDDLNPDFIIRNKGALP